MRTASSRIIKHSSQKGYQTKRAYLLKGEKLPPGEFGVMHGYMKIPELKKVCHAYGVSINEYLVAVYIWSVYTECMHGMPSERPVRVAVRSICALILIRSRRRISL